MMQSTSISLFVRYLKGLQKPQRDLILDAIEKLTHKPAEGDIKKMSGYKDGRYRLRVGKYRIIYKYLTAAFSY